MKVTKSIVFATTVDKRSAIAMPSRTSGVTEAVPIETIDLTVYTHIECGEFCHLRVFLKPSVWDKLVDELNAKHVVWAEERIELVWLMRQLMHRRSPGMYAIILFDRTEWRDGVPAAEVESWETMTQSQVASRERGDAWQLCIDLQTYPGGNFVERGEVFEILSERSHSVREAVMVVSFVETDARIENVLDPPKDGGYAEWLGGWALETRKSEGGAVPD